MGDRTKDRYQSWSAERLLSGIITIFEDFVAAAFGLGVGYPATLMRGLISNTVSRVVRLDASTHAIETISYPHHEIHSGSSFTHQDVVDLTLGQVFDIRLLIPVNPRKPHLVFEFEVESQTQWFFYETVVIDIAGNVRVGVNRNRVPPLLVAIPHIDEVLAANIGAANGNTDITGISFELHGITGTKKSGGSGGDRDEWVMEEEITYCLRFIADVAGWVSYKFNWYEHAPRDA